MAEIEKHFTRLDAAVAALRRVQANLKRHRAAVLKAAVEGRLVPTEAELVQVAGSVGSPSDDVSHLAPPASEDLSPLRDAPVGWVYARAADVCVSVRDGTHDTPAYVEKGVPLVTSKNLLDSGDLELSHVEMISEEDHEMISRRSEVRVGDILFAMIGTVGNPVVVRTAERFSVKNMGIFRCDGQRLLPDYLRTWLASPCCRRWLEPRLRGTTQKFASLALLRSLMISLPPISEQHRIVAEVDSRMSLIKEVELAIRANVRRAAGLRRALLILAFDGRLLPQDPADTPASVLLERLSLRRLAAPASPRTGQVIRSRRGRKTNVSLGEQES